jgi:hypothetical protein
MIATDSEEEKNGHAGSPLDPSTRIIREWITGNKLFQKKGGHKSLCRVGTGYIYIYRSCGNVVGIATGYWLDDQGVGVRVPVGSRTISSPRRPNRLWGPPNLLSNGYRGLFLRG